LEVLRFGNEKAHGPKNNTAVGTTAALSGSDVRAAAVSMLGQLGSPKSRAGPQDPKMFKRFGARSAPIVPDGVAQSAAPQRSPRLFGVGKSASIHLESKVEEDCEDGDGGGYDDVEIRVVDVPFQHFPVPSHTYPVPEMPSQAQSVIAADVTRKLQRGNFALSDIDRLKVQHPALFRQQLPPVGTSRHATGSSLLPAQARSADEIALKEINDRLADLLPPAVTSNQTTGGDVTVEEIIDL